MKSFWCPPLSRRRFLARTAAAGISHVVGAEMLPMLPAQPRVCTLSRQQETGPFYVPDEMIRSDIREGQRGVRLSLKITVLDAKTCQPLPDAAIDLWQCNALGIYSGYTKAKLGPGPGGAGPGGRGPEGGPESGAGPGGGAEGSESGGGPPGPPPAFADGPPPCDTREAGDRERGRRDGPPPAGEARTDQLTFLRGIQLTSEAGDACFETVFPGYYPGRTNHVHFRVRAGGHPDRRTYAAGHVSHTGQILFAEELAAALMARAPYTETKGPRRVRLNEDHVYRSEGGSAMLAQLAALAPGGWEAGIAAAMVVAVDTSFSPAPSEGFDEGRSGGGRFGCDPKRPDAQAGGGRETATGD